MVDFQFGAYRVTRIEESLIAGRQPGELLPNCTASHLERHRSWLLPHFQDEMTGRLISSVHSWLIRGDRMVLLVDCCGGNHKERPRLPRYHQQNQPWLQRLAAAGVRPDEVTHVFCTHLHADHVGWCTQRQGANWVPTFVNARHLFAARELEAAARSAQDPESFDAAQTWTDSIAPLIAADLVQSIECPHSLAADLRIESAPGHTPGHAMLVIQRPGAGTGEAREALFTGDAMHHPLQVAYPHWNSCFCEEPPLAASTRQRVVERAADTPALICAAHFGWPHVVEVRRSSSIEAAEDGGAYRPGARLLSPQD